MRSHTTGPRGSIHLSVDDSANSMTMSNSLTRVGGGNEVVVGAIGRMEFAANDASCEEDEAAAFVLLASPIGFAKDWIRSPSVFSCSGVAFPAAANWSRFASVGFEDAAELT